MECAGVKNNGVFPEGTDIKLHLLKPHANIILKLTVVSVVFYAVGCMAVKSTLLVLYLRIFSPHPRSRRMIYSGLWFNVVFYAISVIVTLGSCLPRAGEGGWESTKHGERCQSEDQRFAEVQGVIGAITDLYVLMVPLPMISDLRLSRRRKLGVFGVFLTGSMYELLTIRELHPMLISTFQSLCRVDHQRGVSIQNVQDRRCALE